MRLLLDTHAFLWWLAGDKGRTSRARAAIADEANDIYVSAASAWEVATKVRLGKLQGAEFIAQEFGSISRSRGSPGSTLLSNMDSAPETFPGRLEIHSIEC